MALAGNTTAATDKPGAHLETYIRCPNMRVRTFSVLFGALLTAAVLANGCEQQCDPGAFLISDCGAGETCDAESSLCEDKEVCTTSEDCAGGYVCYDDETCARNCNSGLFFMFRYCKPGFVCDDQYRCVTPPELVANACQRSCETLAEACVPDATLRPAPKALCLGECVDHWGWLEKDACVEPEVLNDYFRCIADNAAPSQPPECTAPWPAQWLDPTHNAWLSSLWAPPSPCQTPKTSSDFGMQDGSCK